jgi:hypothetical protein
MWPANRPAAEQCTDAETKRKSVAFPAVSFVTLSSEYAIEVIAANGTGRTAVYRTRRDAIYPPVWSLAPHVSLSQERRL